MSTMVSVLNVARVASSDGTGLVGYKHMFGRRLEVQFLDDSSAVAQDGALVDRALVSEFPGFEGWGQREHCSAGHTSRVGGIHSGETVQLALKRGANFRASEKIRRCPVLRRAAKFSAGQ